MERKTIIIDRHICDGEKNNLELEVIHYRNTEIIYLYVTEYIGDIFSSHEEYIESIKQINESLKNNNNKLYVVFGGYDSYRYEILQKLELSEIEFLWWPTFLLHYTYYMMKRKYGKIKKIKTDFDKLYISLNQKPKQHRAMFIDLINENNITDCGLFSWNELTNNWSNDYKFKFWDEKIVRLDINQDRDFLDVRRDYFTEYIYNHGCLFNIVGESIDNNDMFFITEKTYKNLLIGQPIICIGSPYQNKVLKNLGFKIYENLINYSFDEEILIEDRVRGVVKALDKLKNKNPKELYELIKDNTLYNIENCYRILEKDNYIPQKLVELYKEFPTAFKNFNDSYMGVDEYINEIFQFVNK